MKIRNIALTEIKMFVEILKWIKNKCEIEISKKQAIITKIVTKIKMKYENKRAYK